MNRSTLIRTAFAAVALSALAGCIVVPVNTSTNFLVNLSGAQEVPPVAGNASGTLDASYNKLTRELSWKLSYNALSGEPTAAHFHGPARAGANAGVALGISGPLTNPSQGKATLTAEQASDLMAGLWYVNVHTAANRGGEIRGQLTPR